MTKQYTVSTKLQSNDKLFPFAGMINNVKVVSCQTDQNAMEGAERILKVLQDCKAGLRDSSGSGIDIDKLDKALGNR